MVDGRCWLPQISQCAGGMAAVLSANKEIAERHALTDPARRDLEQRSAPRQMLGLLPQCGDLALGPGALPSQVHRYLAVDRREGFPRPVEERFRVSDGLDHGSRTAFVIVISRRSCGVSAARNTLWVRAGRSSLVKWS